MRLFAIVDISGFVYEIFDSLIGVMLTCVDLLSSIIIFDGNRYGVGDFHVNLLEFSVGLVVISIVVGAFVHVNKADNFYSNRKD